MSGDTGGGRPDPKGPKRPRPLKQARVGWPPALRKLKEVLYQVYLAADAPSLDAIAEDIADDDSLAGAPSRDTVHRVITDGERLGQQADVVAVATVLARRAVWDVPDLAGRVRELWVQAAMAQGAGRPIGDLRSDVGLVMDGGLGVHPALDTGGARDRFGILPAYVPRDHDARLNAVVDAAKAGHSGIAVLVGGSSTGKTRALWEAVGELPDSWRLWHPLSPTAPDAVLASLPNIAPKTVVWLNEAQRYLGADPLGEKVAAGLRELLNDPSRGPVLVLGTLWPEHWDILTTRSPHAGARELLGGHKVDVPDAFTPADLAALDATDPRLAQAAQHAKGAQITQYLAGVPYLMDRYQAARGATQALIHAAMDARRLGAGLHLPLDWLADAAPGYLNDDEYRTLDRNWLTQALDYVTEPCNGIPGILTLITHSSPRNQRTLPKHAPSQQGPHYLLADYLDQYGRHHRAETIPPIDFWTAAAHHPHPTDLAALGYAAWNRGLYRDAAQLLKHATIRGNPNAAVSVAHYLHTLHPTDHHPAQWVVDRVVLDDPYAVGLLLAVLWRAGRQEQVTALLARNPAAHVSLDDPGTVAWLLRALQEAGEQEQCTALADRAAAHVPLDAPGAFASLLEALRTAGSQEQVTTLLARNPAAHVPLNDPGALASLLEALRTAGSQEQVTTLLARNPAAHVPLADPDTVASLLRELRRAEADDQFTALANRAAADVSLDHLDTVVWLLDALRSVGADDQFAALANRAIARVALGKAHTVSRLLEALQGFGADEQVTSLADRVAAHATLDNPDTVSSLLETLQGFGADEQVTSLADRAFALDDLGAGVWLLEALWEAGAFTQLSALLARNPAAHVNLDDPAAIASLLQALREVGQSSQVTALLARNPAAHVNLDDPAAIASLLQALRQVGQSSQVTALLARNPAAHVNLDDPAAIASLLQALQVLGADDQFTALADRAAAHVPPDDPVVFVTLLHALQVLGADDQFTALADRAAAHVSPDDYMALATLLQELRWAERQERVTALADRAAAHATFNNPSTLVGLLGALQIAGAQEQFSVLADRAAAHATLDNLETVVGLLHSLRRAGAQEQFSVLADRAAAHAALDKRASVAQLLATLRRAGAHELINILAERLPGAGLFELSPARNGEQFRFGREPDGSAASSSTWKDLD